MRDVCSFRSALKAGAKHSTTPTTGGDVRKSRPRVGDNETPSNIQLQYSEGFPKVDLIEGKELISYPTTDVDILQSLTSIGMQLYGQYETEEPGIETLPTFLSDVCTTDSMIIQEPDLSDGDKTIERVQETLKGADLYKFGVMTNTSGLATECRALRSLDCMEWEAYMDAVLSTYNVEYAKKVKEMITRDIDIERAVPVELERPYGASQATRFTEGAPPLNLFGHPSTICDAVFEGVTTLDDLHAVFVFDGTVNNAYLESRVSLLVYMVGKLVKNPRWRWKGFLLQQYIHLKNTHGHSLVPSNVAAGKALVERDRLQDHADILKRYYYVSAGGGGQPGPFAWWFAQQRAYRRIVQDRHWRRVRAADRLREGNGGSGGNGGGVMTSRAKAIFRFNYHTQIGKLVNCFKKLCKRNILNIDSSDSIPGVLPRRHSLGIMVNRFERYINEIENVVDDFTDCFCRTSNSIINVDNVAAPDGDERAGVAPATTLAHKRGGYRSHHVTHVNAIGPNHPCVVLGRKYCEDNSVNNWYAFCASESSAGACNPPIVWRALIRRFNWCLRHQYSFSPLSRSARITHPGTLMRIYVSDHVNNDYETHNYEYWDQYRHHNPIFSDSIDFRLKNNHHLVPEIYPIMQLPTSHDNADQGHYTVGVVSGRTGAVLMSSMIELLIRLYN